MHDKGKVMLASIADVLYLRGIYQFCSASFLFPLCLHSFFSKVADFRAGSGAGAGTTVSLGKKRTRANDACLGLKVSTSGCITTGLGLGLGFGLGL